MDPRLPSLTEAGAFCGVWCLELVLRVFPVDRVSSGGPEVLLNMQAGGGHFQGQGSQSAELSPDS